MQNLLNIHFCINAEKKIKGQSYEKNIRNKIDDLRKHKKLLNSGALHDYGNGLFGLKHYSPQARIIIEENIVNNITVFFIRDIILNIDFDYYYGTVIHPKLKSGQWLIEDPLLEEDKRNFINNYKKEVNTDTLKIKELPSPNLTNWLDQFKIKIEYDIFETEDWVRYALSDSLTEGMINRSVSLFRLFIKELSEENNQLKCEKIKTINGIDVCKVVKGDLGIIYSRVLGLNGKVLIIQNGANIINQVNHWQKAIQNVNNITDFFDDNFDSICQYSFRAYPKWTTNNDDLWFTIQKNSEQSNLSLTKEQITFFKKFTFPCYINGQAGSGKSTMLYYIFATAYFLKCLDEIKGEIIFLTENKELLKHSQDAVFDLLNNNPDFDGLNDTEKTNVLNKFSSFKDFLVSLLPVENKAEFKENMYLNFSQFKYLYENSYLPKHVIYQYTAEEAWFTIITYIYGYETHKKISSADYLSLVFTKSQKISKEKFEGIENYVLPFYEKLINENGYWDKLKIIRFLDEHENIESKYSVIICDEAQDFCKVELHFILRLSEFLRYDLTNIDQVPIVFAGDPNQTVNPTGFRQGEMTYMIHNELTNVNFNYKSDESIYNPSINYRSTQSIVGLANFIQYFRKKNYEIELVKPQIAKRPETNGERNFNLFFNYASINKNEKLKNDLIEKIKYKVFIIPVDIHEKKSFIENSEFLQMLDEADIKTAVEAKGAEYQQVVLFGFGEYYAKKFKTLKQKIEGDIDLEFIQKYFFNKLYVGVTRAQTELIIIDSLNSENNFWKELVERTVVIDNQWNELNEIKNDIIQYNPDTLSHVLDSTPEIALENARKDKEQGIYDENAARLKVVSSQFYKLGFKDEYFECLAISEKFKGNWRKAAIYFLDSELGLSKIEEAADCLFQGKFFKEFLEDIGLHLTSEKQNLRIILSRLMHGDTLLNEDIEELYYRKELLNELTRSIEWRAELLERFIIDLNVKRDVKFERFYVEFLEALSTDSDIEIIDIIGKLHFKLNSFERAIKIWNKIEMYNTEEYAYAKAEIYRLKNDFENEVIWIGELLKYKNHKGDKDELETRIIEIYQQHSDINSTNRFYLVLIYKIFLLRMPNNNIINLGVKLINAFIDFKSELIEFYEQLILEKNLLNKTAEHVITRWAIETYKKLIDDGKTDIEIIGFINLKYKDFSELYKLNYVEFIIEELAELSKSNYIINILPPEHIVSFKLKNFRRFKELVIKDASLFNLIVGDNNVGKTSLLEALMFTPDKDELFNRLAYAYAERCNQPRFIYENQQENYIMPVNFLKEYIKRGEELNGIEFIINEKRSEWEYKFRQLSLNELKQHFSKETGLNENDFFGLITEFGTELIEVPINIKKLNPNNSIKSPFIPFGNGFSKSLAQVYSEEIDKKKSIRKNFIENMKVFIPDINHIIVDTENGEISIEENNVEEPLSISQYGEGANKLFRILLQIIIQKGKRILVDEIDAGIHYSRFKKFWEVIIKFAESQNTQIFATTHNLECVSIFKSILQEENLKKFQNYSRVITIQELPDKNIKSFTREFKEFEYEIENDMEIRGGE